jgi:hypothetical protein
MEHDLYLILEVEPGADAAVIKASYRRLAKLYHPDVNASPDAPQRMKALNHAYQVLGDPKTRERYDVKRERAKYGYAGAWRRKTHAYRTGAADGRAGTKTDGKAKRKRRRAKRKSPPPENIVPEEHIAQAAELWKTMPRLTVARVAERLGIEEHPAARVFDVLVARKIIDLKGFWLVRGARTNGAGKSGAKKSRVTEAEERLRTDRLVEEAVRKLKLRPSVNVPLIAANLQVSTEQAIGVFERMIEKRIVDRKGEWEPNAARKVKESQG